MSWSSFFYLLDDIYCGLANFVTRSGTRKQSLFGEEVNPMKIKSQPKHSYQFNLSIGFPSARTKTFTPQDWGYDDEEWESLSEEDQKEILDEQLEIWANQTIYSSWEKK